MELAVHKSGGDIRFQMTGRMTFSDHKIFREILQEINSSNYRRIVADLHGLQFIDSFGVGMLLIIKDAAQSRNCDIVLSHPEGQVDHMVHIAKLAHLFTIEN